MSKLVPTAIGVNAAQLVPDYMSGHEHGTALLKNYVQPPRIKIIQPTAKKPFSELFSQGDAVAVPTMQLMAAYDKKNAGKEPFLAVVPLFFFPEWVCWNPLDTKGTLPAVRGRTLDPRDIIAIKARDDKRRNTEPCPEMPEKDGKKLYLKYLEHLNFVLMPLEPSQFAGMPIATTFASGEHRSGSNFSTLITMRKAPIYGCVFELYVRERENAKGRWFGIDADNPRADSGISPWVAKDQFEALKSVAAEYKKAYDDKSLVVDYEDGEEEEKPADSKEF